MGVSIETVKNIDFFASTR